MEYFCPHCLEIHKQRGCSCHIKYPLNKKDKEKYYNIRRRDIILEQLTKDMREIKDVINNLSEQLEVLDESIVQIGAS